MKEYLDLLFWIDFDPVDRFGRYLLTLVNLRSRLTEGERAEADKIARERVGEEVYD